MKDADGTWSMDDLKSFIAESDLEYATLGFVDLQGTVRGKYVSRSKLESALDGMQFPLISLALDPTDAILTAPGIADPESGYSDRPVRVLPESARFIPWERPGRNLFLLCEFIDEFAAYCPRNVYHRIAERAATLGYTAAHAVEFEFTLFNETAKTAYAKNYKNMELATPHKTYYSLVRQGVQAEFYNDLMDACKTLRIPLESLHEEMGDGFMEAAIQYGYGVSAVDNAALFRTFAKIIAQRRGQLATFMARWSNDADGQSGHIHISLKDKQGKPVFYDANAAHTISDTMRYFIGGMQRLMGEFLLLCAPNINSFKRLVPGIFAPISAQWGIENRTCAIRAIPSSPKSTRIECRTPGADANPYLSTSAILAAGLYGIENKLEPSEPSSGNVYDSVVPEALQFPETFGAAIDRFYKSDIARAYFGDAFVNAYALSRKSQFDQFNAMVTDRELTRFFELV